ncbi:hypothetical protein CDAR_495601 [Caerostris darwini]|uniref:Ribosomal protein L32 n=1 Tax=Caerostris darwini TaxID=1538125 RepID=A0AAV4S8P2_9ARAC|nr:hypothetical protein CDAR_495601 [Caerostris darwini]
MFKSKTPTKLAFILSAKPTLAYNRALPHKVQMHPSSKNQEKAGALSFESNNFFQTRWSKFEATGHRRGSGQLSKPQTPTHSSSDV